MDQSLNIVVDSSGNCYTAGSFEGPYCYFTNDTSLFCNGDNDCYIIKYNNNGSEIWYRQLGGNNIGGSCYEGISSMVIDNASNIYFTGVFCGVIDIGGFNLTGIGEEIFLAKMDANGVFIWATKAGGNGKDDASGIALDGSGHIYLCGTNSDQAIFGNDTIPAGGFIVEYDTSGAVMWAKNKFRYRPITISELIPYDIKISNSKILIEGAACNDTLIVDTISIFPHIPFSSSCFSAFDLSGNVEWLKIFGGGNSVPGFDFSVDNSGNSYLTGLFNDTGYFATDTFRTGAVEDVFITKIDINGSILWTRQLHSSNGAEGWATSANQTDGNTYITGYFSGNASCGLYNFSATGNEDMFLLRLDSNGNCLGVRHFGYAEGYGVAQNSNDEPYVCGAFRNTVSIGSNTFSSHGQADIFVGKCDVFTGIDTFQGLQHTSQLIIYSNPSRGKCNIKIPDDFLHKSNVTLSVYDTFGKLIQQKQIQSGVDQIKINLETEAKGIYNVTLSNGLKIYQGKIIFD